MNRWMRAAVVMVIAALTACSDDPTLTVEVDRVEVGPADQVLVVGDSVEITALALAANGDVVVGEIVWRSLNQEVATLRVNGGTAVVSAKAAGTVKIEAKSGGKTGFVMVTVAAAAEVASIELQPTTLVLKGGEERSIQAIAKAENGQVITNRVVTWVVTSGVAVSIAPQLDGRVTVTADTLGDAVIRATIDGVSADAEVQVVSTLPPPQTVATVQITPSGFTLPVNHETPLEAIARTATGEIVSGLPVTWAITVDSVATVTPIGESTYASFLAKKPGTTLVRATVGGVTGQITVQVTPTAPADQPLYLQFEVTQKGIWKDQSIPMAGLLRAIGPSGPIANPAVTWTLSDSSVAAIDAAGNLRGLGKGATEVFATSGSVSGGMQVTVFEVPPGDQVYDLTFLWWSGGWQPTPVIGTDTWTDTTGVQHQITLYATRGTLTLKPNGQYERVIRAEGWVYLTGSIIPKKVIERDLVDSGTAYIIVGGETGNRMVSTITPGYEWKLLPASDAGHLVMRAAIGTAPEDDYLWRLRQ